MSKSKKSKSKSKQNSKQNRAKVDQKRAQRALFEVKANVLELAARTRLAKQQRKMLPNILRARIDSVGSFISEQSKRMAKANLALAEALCGALHMRGLDDYEKGWATEIITQVILASADRHPESITERSREIYRSIVGREIEDVLKAQVQDFFQTEVGNEDLPNEFAREAFEATKFARSPSEVEKITDDFRRRAHPGCGGDLEFFARLITIEDEMKDGIWFGMKPLVDLASQISENHGRSGNVIGLSSVKESVGLAVVSSLANALDAQGVMETLAAHPQMGSSEAVLAKLDHDQIQALASALSAQYANIQEEMFAIATHPDCRGLGMETSDLSVIMSLDPMIGLETMVKREIFFTRLANEIVQNKSIMAVREILGDYMESFDDGEEDEDMFDFDSDFDDDEFDLLDDEEDDFRPLQ